MRVGKIIDFNKFRKILCKVKANGKLVVFVLVFSAGFLAGVLGFKDISFSKKLFDFLAEYFCKARENEAFLTVAVNSFLNLLLLLVITFSSGTSMLGLVFIPISVFSTGFMFGIFGAGLYSAFAYKGVAFFAVLVVPWAVISVISVILSAIEAFDFSLLLTRVIGLKEKCEDISAYFKDYCIKHGLLCIFIALAAIIDGMLSYNFFENFNLF